MELQKLKEHLAKEPNLNLDIMTINVDSTETQTDVKPTLRLYGLKFPVMLDTAHDILNRYHPDGTLPFSVLVNASGEIVEPFSGYSEDLFERVKVRLAAMGGRQMMTRSDAAKPPRG